MPSSPRLSSIIAYFYYGIFVFLAFRLAQMGEFVAAGGFAATFLAVVFLDISRVLAQRQQPNASSWILTVVVVSMSAIITVLGFATVLSRAGIHDDGEYLRKYSESLYFTVVTFATLGYGDIEPTTSARPEAASVAVIGYISLGLILAALAKEGINTEAGVSDEDPARKDLLCSTQWTNQTAQLGDLNQKVVKINGDIAKIFKELKKKNEDQS